MLLLFHVLPLLLGDLLKDDPHYNCFLQLQEITSIVLSPVICASQVPYLRLLIKEYLETFTMLYPHKRLTPKFHYLIHMPSQIIA